jgi:hypothetical protein
MFDMSLLEIQLLLLVTVTVWTSNIIWGDCIRHRLRAKMRRFSKRMRGYIGNSLITLGSKIRGSQQKEYF